MKVDRLSAAIVLVNGNKALLQLRDNKQGITYPDYWCIPGGQVKEGETLEEAAKRELKEEAGYVSENPTLFLTEIYKLPDGKTVERHIFFDIYDEKQEIKCCEGRKIEFKSPDELIGAKVYPGHLEIIKKAIELVSS